MSEISDYKLGYDLTAQRDLLLRAYETRDNVCIEEAIIRVVNARRMRKNGILEWTNTNDES